MADYVASLYVSNHNKLSQNKYEKVLWVSMKNDAEYMMVTDSVSVDEKNGQKLGDAS